MSAKDENEKETVPGPETQSQRWAKYGSNVALMVVLSIVVAGLVTYIVQARDVRIDTTAQRVNSLKPQTMNVLRDLNQDVKIISLYSKTEAEDTENAPKGLNKAAMVSDLLDNYKRASSHITVQVIDPVSERGKVDQLTTELEERYGKEIKSYQQFLAQYEKIYPQLTKMTAAEAEKVTALPIDKLPDDKNGQLLRTALSNVQTDVPRMLSDNKSTIDRMLKEHHPDYKAITSGLEEFLKKLSQFQGGLAEGLPQFKDNQAIPQQIRDYIAGAIPRYQAVKKIAEEQIAAIGKLGELKVDELKRALNVVNPILILGPNDWRILSESQVWPENNNVKMYSDGKVAPNFAGEQQITSAIVALTSTKKPKIAFLRPGGAPLTTQGFPPFVQGGPLSGWAGRLREYNFEVLEKDLSGQWAMQAQMQQQMPSPPDPDWTAISDAVWVVLDYGGQMAGGPEPLAPKLAEHLGHGGSAIILVGPQSDNLSAVMKEWGVEIRPDALAVHEQPPAPPGNAAQIDPMQEVLRQPWVWNIKDYGDADLAQPLRNLDSLLSPLIVVKTTETKGYTTRTLLPLPTTPKAPASWGETDITGLQNGNQPKFDPKTDIAAPIAAGATVEKQGGGRLVVIGAATFAFDRYLDIPDPEIARNEGRFVARFPGNGELANNAAFWCAKMDSMIALSPAALQVSRISDMSSGVLGFWRIGVLLVLLPVAVLLGGVGVYLSRRD
jgi:hypothetical protein